MRKLLLYVPIIIGMALSVFCKAQVKYVVNISTANPYLVPQELFGANADIFPGFLSPEDPSQCTPQWNGSSCVNTNCSGSPTGYHDDFPSGFFNDVNELGFQSFYYPGGSNSRLFHYLPGTNNYGHAYNLSEVNCVAGWSNNSSYYHDYCLEQYYQVPSFFEKFIQLCVETGKHATLNVNPYFMNYGEVKAMLIYAATHQVPVDAIVFGTEIQNDLGETPYCSTYGLPFSNGTSYFNSVRSRFIDSLKVSTLYQNIPLLFSVAGYYPDVVDEYPFGGLDCTILYNNCQSLTAENNWNQQIRSAIINYNNTHNPDLEIAGAVNWWWYPQDNPANDTSIAKNDLINYLNYSIGGFQDCYNNYFDKLLISQWGMKESSPVGSCDYEAEYYNTLLNQFYILERLFRMMDYNRQSGTNFFSGANYFRLASGDLYDPLSGSADSYSEKNTSNFAFKEIKSVSQEGNYFLKPSITPAIPSADVNEVSACVFQNPGECERKLFLLNYSGKTLLINRLKVNGTTVPKPYHGTMTFSKSKSILEKYNQYNTGVREDSSFNAMKLFLKPYSITVVDIGYLTGENCSLNPRMLNEVVTAEPDLRIYPNPAKDVLTVESFNSQINSIVILDISGRKILEKVVGVDLTQVDISNLRDGIYFVVVETQFGRTAGKLIVE